jgi:nucleoside-diphosphate-sugar epimerase
MLESSKLLGMGWKPGTSLKEGIERIYRWYLEHPDEVRDGK